MDWQQLQSLYNQKESVAKTGTLSVNKEPAQSILHPEIKQKTHHVKTFLIILVLLGVLCVISIMLWYFTNKKNTRTPVASTEVVMTSEQIRQAMADEIIAEQKKQQVTPEQVQDILLGTTKTP